MYTHNHMLTSHFSFCRLLKIEIIETSITGCQFYYEPILIKLDELPLAEKGQLPEERKIFLPKSTFIQDLTASTERIDSYP